MPRRNVCTKLRWCVVTLLLVGCFLKADVLKGMVMDWFGNKIYGEHVSYESRQTTVKHVPTVTTYASGPWGNVKEKDYMHERVLYQVDRCNRLKRDGSIKYTFSALPKIHYSREYNISYCSVGKSGSTFMKQFFAIIGNHSNTLECIEDMSRAQIQHAERSQVSFESSDWKKSRLMIVARNPYTRLFSSYVDKVMVPSQAINHVKGDCLLDDTFEEYLEYIVNTGKKSGHNAPTYDRCKVCECTFTYIVKIESFTEDITYALDDINLERNARKLLFRNMNEIRDIWSITGFVKDVMKRAKIPPRPFLKPGCVGWLGIIRNLWTALQFQGYVHQNVTLPLHLYNDTNDYSNETFFLEVIFATRQMYPLTKDEAKTQRQRSLVRAYSEVNKEIIERVKQMYRPDFEIFKYSTDPPSVTLLDNIIFSEALSNNSHDIEMI